MTSLPAGRPTLLDILDLEDVGSDHFRTRFTEPNLTGALYGGQVLAQALRACLFTVDKRAVHSLHGYFIRPGSEAEPVLYQVERTRDGRNFTTRRVTALQSRKVIFHMEASFHDGAEGFSHARRMPTHPGVDEASEEDPFERALNRDLPPGAARPPELLPIVERRMVPVADTADQTARRLLWMRVREAGLTDPALVSCGLAYLSDFWLGGVSKVLHPEAMLQRMTSVDHAMWFHQPADPSGWLLYDMESPWAGSARSLAQGRIYHPSGDLIASVAQEVYLFPGEVHEAPRRGELT
ncbi:acyl-CoA thioesterase II [Rhizobium sp. CRIBSB]|nr:acyl-CoA thioesterase II [Rhizobium sp. CRIBSB]